MKRKSRQTRLPRLTVLAMSRTDLGNFVMAVDTVSHLVADLVQVKQDLLVELQEIRRKRLANSKKMA